MKPSDYIRKGWTKGALARDKGFVICDPWSKKAARWCASGAVMAWTKSENRRNKYFETLAGYSTWYIQDWNDNPRRTKAQILRAMRAVEKELGL